MKKKSLLAILLLTTVILQAKDVTIKVTNQNSLTIDVFVGVLTAEQNNSSDEDLIASINSLGISNLGESIKANGIGTLVKKEVKKDRYILVFGQFKGGGRTEMKRFKSNDIWSNPLINITFEAISTITPNNSFVNIIGGLKQVNNTGAYIALESIELLGTFLLYREKTDTIDALAFPIIPKNKVIPERFNTKSTSIEDIITSEASASINVEFPMSSQVKGVFGTSKIMSLEWVVVNSGPVIYKPENGSYYELFLSCSEKDRKIALDEFKKYPTSTKLLFIRNAHLTDTVRLETYSLSKIELGIQVQAGDISDVSGNYKRSKTSSLKSKEVRIIKEVFGLDVSPILNSELVQYKEDKDVAEIKLIVEELKSQFPNLEISEKTARSIKESIASESNKNKIDEDLSSITAKKIPLSIETVGEIKKTLEGQ